MPTPLLRLIVLFLIFSGVADFICFDRTDPFASMSTPDHVTATAKGARAHPACLVSVPLPDDQCLCCGLSIPAKSVVLIYSPLITAAITRYTIAHSFPPIDLSFPPPKA